MPRIDLRLAVQRQVVGVFGHEDQGDRRLCRQAALDEPCRGRLLDDDVLAGPAGIAGPARDQDAELGRDDVEPLRAILPDLMERAAAAWQLLSSRSQTVSMRGQMGRQRTTVGSPLGRGRAACRLALCFRRGRVRRDGLLHILQPEQQLILGSVSARRPKRWRCIALMIASSRSARWRSATSIAFQRLGIVGSGTAMLGMTRLNHIRRRPASRRQNL